jgi:hypothetical protein
MSFCFRHGRVGMPKLDMEVQMLDQNPKQSDYAEFRKVLEPLRKVWPTVHAELIEACDRGYKPSRLGSILASEIDKLIGQTRSGLIE